MTMTTVEAIELLQKALDDPGSVDILDLNHAQSLGIEAIKFRQRWEQQEGESDFPLLPSETRE